jgi:hypothetical protein
MALETKCLTPDATFHTYIGEKLIAIDVELPFNLNINKHEATLLESLIHNQLEVVLRSYFDGR